MATNRSLLLAAASGILGLATGAGAVLLAKSVDLRGARNEVDVVTEERVRALVEVESLRKENASLREERDRLRAQGAPVAPAKSGAAEVPVSKSPSATAAGLPPVDAGVQLQRSARELSAKWVADAVQIRDEARRNEAIAAVRAALAGGDPVQVLAGLFAVRALGQVPYDKVSMRPLVLAQFESADPVFRAAALNCVSPTSEGPDPANLELLLRLKDDPSPLVRKELAAAVSWAAKGDLTGEAGAVVLRAIQDIEAEEKGAPAKGGQSEFIRQLGGRTYFRRMSPEIEERILSLVRNPETRESALHFFFQNMEKTAGVVDVLIEIAEDGGSGGAGATRALTYEVPADQAPRVAAFLVKVLESGPSHQVQQVLFGLRNFGTEAELPAMDRLAANELLGASTRRMIAEAAEFIRRRTKR